MTERRAVARADFHAALAVPARRRVLDLLRAADHPRDAHQLAGEMGMHVTTVRFHLETLRRAGLVVRIEGVGGQVGRPRTTYAPVSRCPGTVSDGYRELAGVLAAQLARDDAAAAERAEQAGVAWADRLVPDRLVPDRLPNDRPPNDRPPNDRPPNDGRRSERTLEEGAVEVGGLFAEMGFDPDLEPVDSGQRIALHACPFRDVAREHPEIVCSVHRGLLRAALRHMGVSAAASLTPFVEPELCVVDIG